MGMPTTNPGPRGQRTHPDSGNASQNLRRCAGLYFDEMSSSFDRTMEFLRDPDPRARLGAIAFLREFWRPPADFADTCEKIVKVDADLNVRCIALNSLIDFYYGTHDMRIGRWLATIVRDDHQPSMLRKIAYSFLYSIRAIVPQPMVATLEFPEDVDWDFVESFAAEKADAI
jgi:hypothetical protein